MTDAGPADWDGDEYQRRFDRLAESGADVHGEADLVSSLSPGSVLDAGCGTGRVAIELARRGIEAVGVDLDASMISTARRRAPELDWHECSLAELDLGRTFDVVVMAGNVVLFTPDGTLPDVLAGCARHVREGGTLVAGFSLGRGVELHRYDELAATAGLDAAGQYSTWQQEPWTDGDDYVVRIHTRREAPR